MYDACIDNGEILVLPKQHVESGYGYVIVTRSNMSALQPNPTYTVYLCATPYVSERRRALAQTASLGRAAYWANLFA